MLSELERIKTKKGRGTVQSGLSSSTDACNFFVFSRVWKQKDLMELALGRGCQVVSRER